jgi:AraC family transcriptional regulator, regulatory protein of adaptative response / methylated-DNA-[protein]-cysteine methyltransferase
MQLPDAESVLGAALDAGYGSTRGAYQHTAAISPAQRRRKGAGETLRYATSPCPLGCCWWRPAKRGYALCCSEMNNRRYSKNCAPVSRQQICCPIRLGSANGCVQSSLQLEEPTRAAQLPLDLRGTAFQQQVWQALRSIPPGETRRYGELAASLGSHARAVARACASNPVGLLVPCHRVVGANQALTGYRWGVERKAALLDSERDESGA